MLHHRSRRCKPVSLVQFHHLTPIRRSWLTLEKEESGPETPSQTRPYQATNKSRTNTQARRIIWILVFANEKLDANNRTFGHVDVFC